MAAEIDDKLPSNSSWVHEAMRRIAVTALILAPTAAQSMADGVMFWREEIPPKIPYQRALILFDKGTETLILQSKYEIPKGDGNSTLGWVVPVPAVPEVASMPADMAWGLFMGLSEYSRPRITLIGPIVFAVLFGAVAGLSLLTLLVCLLSFVLPLPQRFKENRGRLARYSMLGLLISFPIIILRFTILRGSQGVDVIAEQRVGIYDVSVVRSDNTEGLIGWLNKNDFKFGDRDRAAFDSYISKGWCFVVAIINPSTGEKEPRIALEGLAAPLILRFPHTNPTYPVALTGTGGFETEILIYLASSTKMTANDRLTLRFAGEMRKGLSRELLSADIDPEGFFDPKKMNFPYLCKFKDRLTPDRMREDIIFSEAEDDKPYREHIVSW
jgi:Uncharacterized protein conserved in bacteria (DUF2330)